MTTNLEAELVLSIDGIEVFYSVDDERRVVVVREVRRIDD